MPDTLMRRHTDRNRRPPTALDKLWRIVGQKEIYGDGTEAERHLKAGKPVYYADPAYPVKLVKKYPDGRKELVVFDQGDNEIVEKQLS